MGLEHHWRRLWETNSLPAYLRQPSLWLSSASLRHRPKADRRATGTSETAPPNSAAVVTATREEAPPELRPSAQPGFAKERSLGKTLLEKPKGRTKKEDEDLNLERRTIVFSRTSHQRSKKHHPPGPRITAMAPATWQRTVVFSIDRQIVN